MIVVGASAYSRTIDFPRFQHIAQAVGAYLLVDIAHISGLVATGLHPTPIPYADFVTSTIIKLFADLDPDLLCVGVNMRSCR